jgi:hypothetical protein
MPTGFGGIRNEAQASRARREAATSGGKFDYFALEDGETAVVRFLEQGDDRNPIVYCKIHKLPHPDRPYGEDVVCLDQDGEGEPCPACDYEGKKQDEIRKTKFKGYINLIWRDGPVFKKDENDRIVKPKQVVGQRDGVFVWSSGIQLFEQLDELDEAFKGLRSRDFKVKRTGKKLDTKYTIQPYDPDAGPVPMSKEDIRLDEDKTDLLPLTVPMAYNDMAKKLGGRPSGRDSSSSRNNDDDDNVFMRDSGRSAFSRD